MRETRADTRRALLEALGLHAVLFALLFAGLQWSRDNAANAAAGEPIEAELVDPGALSAAMQRALQREAEPLPEPVPEPVQEPLPAPVPEDIPEPQPQPEPAPAQLPPPVPDPAPVEQERVRRDSPSPEVAKVPREQEQQRKPPPQVDLDAQKRAEEQRRAEQQRVEKQRAQQQRAEQERQRQLEQIGRQREQAARERTRAEMRAQQLADARNVASAGSGTASPAPGNRGTDTGLEARYIAAIQQAIVRQWVRPESVQLGQRCRITIRQLPGGEVADVAVSGACPLDDLGRQSVERAVLKASPLPYAGYESVFNRTLNLNFLAEDR